MATASSTSNCRQVVWPLILLVRSCRCQTSRIGVDVSQILGAKRRDIGSRRKGIEPKLALRSRDTETLKNSSFLTCAGYLSAQGMWSQHFWRVPAPTFPLDEAAMPIAHRAMLAYLGGNRGGFIAAMAPDNAQRPSLFRICTGGNSSDPAVWRQRLGPVLQGRGAQRNSRSPSEHGAFSNLPSKRSSGSVFQHVKTIETFNASPRTHPNLPPEPASSAAPPPSRRAKETLATRLQCFGPSSGLPVVGNAQDNDPRPTTNP